MSSIPVAAVRRSGAGRPRDESKTPQIVLAVLDIISEVGYQALRVEAVAVRAGVSPGSVYRRWPTKQELVIAALDSTASIFALEETGDTESDLLSLMTDLAERLSEPNHSRLALLAADPNEPEVARAARRHLPPVRAYLRSLIEQRIGAGHPALELLVDVGPALVWYRALVAGERIDAPALVTELDRYLLDGVGVTGAAVERVEPANPVDIGAPAPGRRDAARNRRRIVAAATSLYAEHTPAEVSLAEVAQRAGVSRATIVRHVGTKDQLLVEVHKQQLADVADLCDRALAEDDPARGLEILVRGLALTAPRDVGLRDQLSGRGVGEPGWSLHATRARAAVDEVLDRARHDGSLRPGIHALDLCALVFGTAAVTPHGAPALYLDVLLQGLAPPPAP